MFQIISKTANGGAILNADIESATCVIIVKDEGCFLDKKQYEITYWNQYLLLEKEFLETTLYVELDVANYSTYSNAYLKLLLSIGSEVDNVLRELTSLTGRSCITTYARSVLSKYPNIVIQDVETVMGKKINPI